MQHTEGKFIDLLSALAQYYSASREMSLRQPHSSGVAGQAPRSPHEINHASLEDCASFAQQRFLDSLKRTQNAAGGPASLPALIDHGKTAPQQKLTFANPNLSKTFPADRLIVVNKSFPDFFSVGKKEVDSDGCRDKPGGHGFVDPKGAQFYTFL